MEKKTARTKSSKGENQGQGITKNQPEDEIPFEEDNLYLNVYRVKNHRQLGIIGETYTFLAMKDPRSYMIGSNHKGIKVIQNDTEIYSEPLLGEEELSDIVYIDHLDCYLLSFKSKIYRKDTNSRFPYFYMDLNCYSALGKCFQYSRLNQKLIVAKNERIIAIINLENKRVEFEIRKDFLNNIQDFKLLGSKENKIVVMTYWSQIYVFTYNYNLKKICYSFAHRVQRIEDRHEGLKAMVSDDKGDYLLVPSIDQDFSFECLRMILFRVF